MTGRLFRLVFALLIGFVACGLSEHAAISRAINAGIGTQAQQHASLGTIQTGTEQTTFSSANYDENVGSGPPFASGQSFVWAFRWGSSSPAHAVLHSFYETTADGWALDVAAGVPTLLWYSGGTTTTVATNVTLAAGYHVLAATWDNGTSKIRYSVDATGVVASNVASQPAGYTAPTGTAHHRIGCDNGSNSFPGGVYHAKHYTRVLSDLELVQLAGDRAVNTAWVLPAASGGDSAVDWDARPGRDWNGVASTWTTLGSSPTTFTVAGSPALATVTARQITRTAFLPGSFDTLVSPIVPVPYGRTIFTTTDTIVYACSTYGFGDGDDLKVYKDGSYVGVLPSPPGPNGASNPYPTLASKCNSLTLDGASHLIEIDDGSTATGTNVLFTNLGSIYTSSAPFVPTTAGSSTWPARKVVAYGDSIVIGGVASPFYQFGWAPMLRDVYRGKSPSIGFGFNAYSGRSLNGDITGHYTISTLAAELVAMLQQVQPGGAKWLIDSMGTNDYQLGSSAAGFQTNETNLWTTIHSLDASINILAQTMWVTTEESTPNGAGNTPPDFRTAKTNAASGLAYVTVLNGLPVMPSGDITGAPVHPNNAGHALAEAAICAALPFGC